ncbi:hypothetical protein AQF52_5956 [Streptomyces venezuelae]|nr:hypothetical protein AQF52_5956 [Streptomyces venezuelae]QPK48449.1 hypothetical protein H4W23_29930 [Streptomyces gardneri]CUM37910.1 hypothetical protein BN2537_4785 [Streptomyces venezuelae]
MNPSPDRLGRPVRSRAVTAAAAVVLVAFGATAVVACDGGGDDTSGPTFSERPSPPITESFSGAPPSALASSASEAIESARASASTAAASASAREASRKASIGAEIERSRRVAEEELQDVQGRGNALSEVAVTGKTRTGTGGVTTAVVNITNKTQDTASYAVQVDFIDAAGTVVETQFVGEEDLAPGERRQPLVISRQPPEPVLTARLTKAQRY